jgi:hypothetical protein
LGHDAQDVRHCPYRQAGADDVGVRERPTEPTAEEVLYVVLAALSLDRSFEDVLTAALRASGRDRRVLDEALQLCRISERNVHNTYDYTRAERLLAFAAGLTLPAGRRLSS